jgi:hypothetical protein
MRSQDMVCLTCQVRCLLNSQVRSICFALHKPFIVTFLGFVSRDEFLSQIGWSKGGLIAVVCLLLFHMTWESDKLIIRGAE